MTSWPNGSPPKPERRDHRAERNAAAEDAPVDGAAFAGFRSAQEHAGDRNRRDDQGDEENRLPRRQVGKPSGQPRDRENPARNRESPEHLHHAELDPHHVVRPFVAGLVGACDDLRRHGVRNHVLHHGADSQQQRAHDVELIGTCECEPSAGGPCEDEQTGRHEGRADHDVGFPLRAEDRHGVDQFAEHHLDRPGQHQPYGDAGEFRRCERKTFLDPEIAGHVDQADRAVGEIHHDHRQVARSERLDRPHDAVEPYRLDFGRVVLAAVAVVSVIAACGPFMNRGRPH